MWCLLRISSLEVVGLGTFTFLEKKKKDHAECPILLKKDIRRRTHKWNICYAK